MSHQGIFFWGIIGKLTIIIIGKLTIIIIGKLTIMSFFTLDDVPWVDEVMKSGKKAVEKRQMLLDRISPLRFVTIVMLSGYRREDIQKVLVIRGPKLTDVVNTNIAKLDSFSALVDAVENLPKYKKMIAGIESNPYKRTDEMKLRMTKDQLVAAWVSGGKAEVIPKSLATEDHSSRGAEMRNRRHMSPFDTVPLLQQASQLLWYCDGYADPEKFTNSQSVTIRQIGSLAVMAHRANRKRRRNTTSEKRHTDDIVEANPPPASLPAPTTGEDVVVESNGISDVGTSTSSFYIIPRTKAKKGAKKDSTCSVITLDRIASRVDTPGDGDCLGHSLRHIEVTYFGKSSSTTAEWRQMIEDEYMKRKTNADKDALYSRTNEIDDVCYLTDEVVQCWCDINKATMVVVSIDMAHTCALVIHKPGFKMTVCSNIEHLESIHTTLRVLGLGFFILHEADGGGHYSAFDIKKPRKAV